MRILVLGSKGQLGRCLRDQLSLTDHAVFFASRDQLDIVDFDRTKRHLRELSPDIVINATAYTAVDNAEEEQETADIVNHLAVANIANLCREQACWLIHISTDYVFDGLSETPYEEDNPTNPQGVYGKTKLKGEKAIQSSGCIYTIIRTAWVFSEYGSNFLKTMLRLSAEQNELRVVGDQVGCPTYAQDIAKAIIAIIDTYKLKEVESSVYHFAGDLCLSWADFCREIIDQASKLEVIVSQPRVISIRTKDFPTPAKRPAQSRLNSGKLTADFGTEPSDCLRGIRSSLLAIKNQGP